MKTKGLAAPPWERVEALDWEVLGAQLDERGFAVTEEVLDEGERAELAALFDAGRFRSTVDMARHRFGDGRYRYFDHPLPAPIGELRAAFYAYLAPVANEWAEPRPRPHPAAWRLRHLPHPPPSWRRQAWLAPRRHAPRGEHGDERVPHRPRDHLP